LLINVQYDANGPVERRETSSLLMSTCPNTITCRLFAHNAQCNLDKTFSMYSDDIASTCSLKSVISDMLFG